MVVVVGTQIVGARPTEALPVTVIGEDELDAIAASSGDDLFRSIPQLGDVAFNTTRTIGSLNDARGDTASINLRALGTGNTLVLLNGRRMVNHPGTQAENLVPVVTVNTNSIPTMGVRRIEVLLDGASAIYGADAVAGVVNTVLKDDLEGFTLELTTAARTGLPPTSSARRSNSGVSSDDGRDQCFRSSPLISPAIRSSRATATLPPIRTCVRACRRTGRRTRTPSVSFNNTSITSAWGMFDRFTHGQHRGGWNAPSPTPPASSTSARHRWADAPRR